MLNLLSAFRYDEFLELSRQGDNLVLDLIVKDICGELVGQKVYCLPSIQLNQTNMLFPVNF